MPGTAATTPSKHLAGEAPCAVDHDRYFCLLRALIQVGNSSGLRPDNEDYAQAVKPVPFVLGAANGLALRFRFMVCVSHRAVFGEEVVFCSSCECDAPPAEQRGRYSRLAGRIIALEVNQCVGVGVMQPPLFIPILMTKAGIAVARDSAAVLGVGIPAGIDLTHEHRAVRVGIGAAVIPMWRDVEIADHVAGLEPASVNDPLRL